MTKELLSSESSDTEDGGIPPPRSDLKVNADYARRFEHNKKREELQRLEEKIGKSHLNRKRNYENEQNSSVEDGSTSESEDEGELATEALDSEILATISAIKSKDPRVYDKSSSFYGIANDDGTETVKAKREMPMHLQDYHRKNLLHGAPKENIDPQPLSYNEEQEQLKRSIVGEIRAAAEDREDILNGEEETTDEFLVKRKKVERRPDRVALDVENADKDPETFLSNFMSSRAWASTTTALHPFESDDDEEEKRADEFEEAYNLRFEDPKKSNEKLNSHARDLAAKYSVRRDEDNPRKRKREFEKVQKASAKQQLREEKARLKKLRIEEAEEKIRRIRRAAGIRQQNIRPEDWAKFVDDEWDDQKWEDEMKRRFGDEYYADRDVESDGEDIAESTHKIRKPHFADDIDIKDIIPDFDNEEKRTFTLSDDEDQPSNEENANSTSKTRKVTRDQKRKDTKKERRLVEHLVEDQIEMELNGNTNNASKTVRFRYRETSPKAFGLMPEDILMADDSQLNQFAGLKKLAAFRDPEKKRKDAKHLGKRARLRKWRQETFGNEDGVQVIEGKSGAVEQDGHGADEEDGAIDFRMNGEKKKRRRRKKAVAAGVEG